MPVIIRRPHAYRFLERAFAGRFEGTEEIQGGDFGVLVGAFELPIPGFYVLDGRGEVLDQASLAKPGARRAVLALLETSTRP